MGKASFRYKERTFRKERIEDIRYGQDAFAQHPQHRHRERRRIFLHGDEAARAHRIEGKTIPVDLIVSGQLPALPCSVGVIRRFRA